MSNATAENTVQRDENGRLLPGSRLPGAGRPKGYRAKLAEEFTQVLYEEFMEHGADAVRQFREESPAGFVKCIAGLMPRDHKIGLAEDTSVVVLDFTGFDPNGEMATIFSDDGDEVIDATAEYDDDRGALHDEHEREIEEGPNIERLAPPEYDDSPIDFSDLDDEPGALADAAEPPAAAQRGKRRRRVPTPAEPVKRGALSTDNYQARRRVFDRLPGDNKD